MARRSIFSVIEFCSIHGLEQRTTQRPLIDDYIETANHAIERPDIPLKVS
ncbi:hypothetical protein PDR5_20460 [Pseudomonas sp. DR 5-09]|nr:hypothetical protein PDR5_20460 [Pseudomonas sp. DR 5-09]